MELQKNKKPILYIIPTPIGNLLDITYRAIETLKTVDLVIAENKHHAQIILKNFSIKKTIITINKNNEKPKSIKIISKIQKNIFHVALISNAGTPLISDPGYLIVNYCYRFNIKVIPLPGSCSLIVALVGSGLNTNRFCYEGFIPKKKNERINLLKVIKYESRTTIFFESKKRIVQSLKDMLHIWGPKKNIVIARELTKIWENIEKINLEDIFKWIKKNKQIKGEIIIVVQGYKKIYSNLSKEIIENFNFLLKEINYQKAIKLISKIYKIKKNILYNYYMENKIY